MNKACDICGVTDKKRKVYWNRKLQLNLCNKHRNQIYVYGYITDRSSFSHGDPNEINIFDDHAEITLRDINYNIAGKAIIDIDDIEKCKKYKWNLNNKHGYVVTYPNRKPLTLHRFILNYKGKLDIDHINRNKLDNRKNNLRIVPKCINSANNGCTGVKRASHQKSGWVASIIRYGVVYNLGTFKTKEEALQARQIKKEWLDENDLLLRTEYEKNKEPQTKGVRKTPYNTWTAIFYANGKKHHVGTYKTKEEAINARAKAINMYNKTNKSA